MDDGYFFILASTCTVQHNKFVHTATCSIGKLDLLESNYGANYKQKKTRSRPKA